MHKAPIMPDNKAKFLNLIRLKAILAIKARIIRLTADITQRLEEVFTLSTPRMSKMGVVKKQN